MTFVRRCSALMGAVVASMLMAPVAFAQDQAMTGEQVKAAMVGKKVFGRSTSGGLVDFYMRADGTSEVAVGNMTDTGVWRTVMDQGEQLELLAREGQPVPDTAGAPIAGLTFSDFTTPVLGDDGRIAFIGTLSSGAKGVYAAGTDGILRQLMVTGAAITLSDVDTGTRTVTPGGFDMGNSSPAHPVPLQQRAIGGGKLVFHATFGDLTTAAVVLPVP